MGDFTQFVTVMPKNDKIRADEFCKKYLLRDFRKMLNHSFNLFYGKSRHFACKKTLEKMVKAFFTGSVWKDLDTEELLAKDAVVLNIPEHVFDQHKDIFTVLIYSTNNL